jgi:hypothetical protein
MLSTELFAISQERPNKGGDRCHWCGSECGKLNPHDDYPHNLPFIRPNRLAKCPGHSYICNGCLLWRRAKGTINLLSGGMKDGKHAPKCSWYVNSKGAWVIWDILDFAPLWELLLNPPVDSENGSPLPFCLMMLEGGYELNHLQLGIVNEFPKIEAETLLSFTLNNNTLKYSIYEAKEALKAGLEGTEPGVHTLYRLLGKPDLVIEEKKHNPKGGRPRNNPDGANPTRKVIAASGMIVS